MSSLNRTSGLLSCLSLLPAALLAFFAAGVPASAQTAPQLVPYTAKLIAGSGTTAIAKGAACPVSGNTSTDAYGDGCLATEVQLGNASAGGPRYAVADKNGNIFFGDFVNGLVRRVDAQTGIITAVAGGASSSPSTGTACTSGTLAGVSTDSDGDGCPATLVKLSKPAGVVFDTTGNLYFADNGFDNIRRIAADPTTGLITTTGIITHIAGNSTFGYSTNNGSPTPVLATSAYLNFPYGLAFDAAGNLYVADEGNNAISVINTGATARTIQGFTVPAGTIQKISGWGNLNTKTASNAECPQFTAAATGSRGGCYFGKWTDGTAAATTYNDGVYSVAVDASGNVYFANEFNNDVGFITSANIISNYAGIQGTAAKKISSRGTAGSFGIGSVFGVALDPLTNLYVTDASSGAIWRVDSAGKVMYAIAGGGAATMAGSPCPAGGGTATDTLGDGCPALQANFGSSGTGNFASTTLPGPGIYGISADAYGDVFVGDTETFTIREVASGTQFGPIGANQAVTNTLDVHFAPGDGPAASGAYTITAGGSTFTLGTAKCTANSPDNTMDCLLPLTATATTLGPFSGTLQVKSSQGGTATFPLSGISITSPFTRTAVTVTGGSASCSGATSFSTATTFTLTANITSTGSPTGTVTFFANGNQIGQPVQVANSSASMTTTFSTAGKYTITATYSGDTYFKSSTGTAASSVTTANPSFTAAVVNDGTTNVYGGCPPGMVGQCAVSAGGTALYSFTITQNVYTGTINFACQGLPAYASCVFSPSSITATGCSTTSTVALSITTQQPGPIKQAFLGIPGAGRWTLLGIVPAFALALLLGFRRRRAALRFAQLGLALSLLFAMLNVTGCGNGAKSTLGTPTGTSTITVAITGSNGTSLTVPVTLTVK